MSGDERWIVVPNWDKFQHYKDRDPSWIKAYLELIHKQEYLGLTLAERGLLHGIWLLFASSGGCLRAKSVGQLLTCRPRDEHWESLNRAGFIRFSASKPLALARSREKRREEKKELKAPLANQAKANTPTPHPGTASAPTPERQQADAAKVSRMIGNGVITDPTSLDAEIDGYHLADTLATELHHQLATTLGHD